MIFVTTGTQEPFDRFLKIIDAIVPYLHEEIIVQAFRDIYNPKNFSLREFISPGEFVSIMERSRLVVSHAGMGTILSALRMDKPIVVFPRVAAMGEHRNEHQIESANKMYDMGYVYLASDENALQSYMLNKNIQPLKKIDNKASDSLINSLVDFIG
ncbi:MAG: glycosyl transferase family 28 [Muribaculaceae bacterium]|nr:glycosyl transferase family 28 [Muribaculaceae bacterium]